MSTVLLSGYYGFDNIGDEAVLGGLLAGLRAELPDVEPVVLSANPAATERLHGARAIGRMKLSAIQDELSRASLLISGGGSLLQDVTSARSPYYYLGILWMAQKAGVPTAVVAQGLGPLRRLPARLLARTLLNRTRAITVRDPESAEFLAQLPVTVPPIEVTADPSFLLEPDASERLATWWAARIPVQRPVLGVALRRWQAGRSPERYQAISEALAALAQQTGALLLFLPMQFDQDARVAEEMAGWTPAESRVLDFALTPREMLDAVGRCDAILAMRLHALIFAVQRDVPAFGLAYDPKVTDFALSADLPIPPQWDTLTADTLTPALTDFWTCREAAQLRLQPSRARLTTLARRNMAVVKRVLETGSGIL